MSDRLKSWVLSLTLSVIPFINANAQPSYPVGGGPGFSPINSSSSGQITVTTAAQLQSALSNGYSNIFISGTLDFDATPGALVIPSNVTLFSDRGLNGSAGGLLRFALAIPGTQSFATIQVGSNVTFTGLRIQGPTTAMATDSLAYGIQQANGTNLVVTNSELSGWPGAAISFKKSTGGQVKYNYIHHNRRNSRGYGVVVQNGNAQANIMYNVFEANRHAIAGSGKAGEVYTAAWNLVLPEGNGHAFDMHKGSGTTIGGQQVVIQNNMFHYGSTCWGHQPSANIRAVPTSGPATVTGNWFLTPVQFTDCGGRSKRTVEGVSGAIPSQASLTSSNTFGASFSYNQSYPCSVTETSSSTTWPVYCEAVGGTSGGGSGGGGGGEEEEED